MYTIKEVEEQFENIDYFNAVLNGWSVGAIRWLVSRVKELEKTQQQPPNIHCFYHGGPGCMNSNLNPSEEYKMKFLDITRTRLRKKCYCETAPEDDWPCKICMTNAKNSADHTDVKSYKG